MRARTNSEIESNRNSTLLIDSQQKEATEATMKMNEIELETQMQT